MTQYLVVKGPTYLPIEPLVIVGIIYFLMTFILSKVFGHFERKLKRATGTAAMNADTSSSGRCRSDGTGTHTGA